MCQATETTTFKCEGCGRRYPATAQWWRAEATAQRLLDGRCYDYHYVKGARTPVIIPQVCSEACAAQVAPRTLKSLWVHHAIAGGRLQAYRDFLAQDRSL